MRSRAELALLLALAASPARGDDWLKADDRSIKVFVDYRKATLILSPKHDDESSVSVFQPNAGPALGLGVKLGPYVSGGFSRSVIPWQRDTANRGHSSITHYELHWYRQSFGADLFHQSYTGMFLDQIPENDLGVMGDALFRKSESPELFPRLALGHSGLNVFYNFGQVDFDAGAFMTQGGHPTHTGWSPLVMASTSQTTFGNGHDPLEASGLSGGLIQSAALLPGLGGAIVAAPCYASAIVFWGFAVQDYEFYGAAQQGKTRPAATGNLRGSVGYSSDEWFGGILGYKSIMTIDSPELLLTTTSSLVEMHVGRRF